MHVSIICVCKHLLYEFCVTRMWQIKSAESSSAGVLELVRFHELIGDVAEAGVEYEHP